jgi:hypothetical protein
MFGSQTRARIVNTHVQLATAQKSTSTVAEYMNKMRSLDNEMAAAGRTFDEEELVEYILTGLNHEYDPIVSAVIARESPVSLSELYAQLLAFEMRLVLMGTHEGGASLANSASRGHGGTGRGSGRDSSTRRGYNSGHGGRGDFGRSGYNSSNDKCPLCQVCKKNGHTANRCWHRFDEDYVPEERTDVAVAGSNGHDSAWYTDSRATDHLTSDLEKLAVHDKYHGNNQIHTASGSGMNISHYWSQYYSHSMSTTSAKQNSSCPTSFK